MTVAEYMTVCLLDPVDGYYPTKNPLGADGDFVTAPEISQMFGEMLGLWVVQGWEDMGQPTRLNLVEYGPGRGVMMDDILRAVRVKPDCSDALNVYLIEVGAALEAAQVRALSNAPAPVNWIKTLNDVPDEPILIIGNEYLDCLPVRQFILRGENWHERVVVEKNDDLQFAISPEPVSQVVRSGFSTMGQQARDGDLLEVGVAVQQVIDDISARLKYGTGRALFMDYGPKQTEFVDTLQALKKHKKVDVFSDPGNMDLTVRVNFGALTEFAKSRGLHIHGPVTQAEFLSRLGIETRAVMLARARPDAEPELARQLARLMMPDQMGEIFKFVSLQSARLQVPLGFED